MMTIRFTNGFSVQYNRASYVIRYQEYSDLYTKKDGVWIAQVPNSCIIELESPCRMYNALYQDDRLEGIERAVNRVNRKITTKKTQRKASRRK